MHLLFHEAVHLSASLLISLFVYTLFLKKNKRNITILLYLISASIVGGVLIDLDHLFDYFMAFGFHFRLDYFFQGYAFQKNDKIYVPFHSYELIFLLLGITTLLKTRLKKAVLLVFTLSMLLHVTYDIYDNHMKILAYSTFYRITRHYKVDALVDKDHYEDHLLKKKIIRFKDPVEVTPF